MKSTKTPEEKKKLCNGCTTCCEYITIIINPPKTYKEVDRIKWYLLHNVHVYITNAGEWKVDIPMKCTALNNKGECSIYEERPQLCKDHSQDSCERYDTSDDNQTLFTSVKEFQEYLNSQKNKLNIV